MGASVESDRYRGRIDELRASGACVKFLSLEPLLGPLPDLDLASIDWVLDGRLWDEMPADRGGFQSAEA
jgi:protein gp37